MDKNTLKRLQDTELEMLKQADLICKKHNLSYFLIAGTLLGAVRHKGFIPWDDDIDIALPRKDYELFLKYAQDELPQEYSIQFEDTEIEYWFPYAKIRKNGTVFEEPMLKNYNGNKGIFIDIFPLDYVPKAKSKIQTLQYKVVKVCQELMVWKKFGVGIPNKVSKKILFSVMSIKQARYIQKKVMIIYSKKKKCDYFVNLGSYYDVERETILIDKYMPPTEIEFCGTKFLVPKDYDYILKKIYGDYMKLPPVDERKNHNPSIIKFD